MCSGSGDAVAATGAAWRSSVTGAAHSASSARASAAVSALHTIRTGWAKRAQTETSPACIEHALARSASDNTAYLAASVPCAAGKTLGGISALARAIHPALFAAR